jgi:lysophospholipase L1-like esterase
MRLPCRCLFLPIALCYALCYALSLHAQQGPGLMDGDLVAICGDSITEQKDYSVNIQSYLLMCQPKASLQTVQFGWGGETSWGFKARMENDTLRFHPTVATTCYGMNDGGYGPLAEDRAKLYRDSQTAIVQQFKQAGVRFIVVGSPGAVDSDTFRRDPEQARIYNQTLSQLRDISREVAEAEGVTFANVYDPMIKVMEQCKEKYGHEYHVCGGDGVHPSRNGHLVMAYAFLKALGCDGQIGTIEYDLAGNSASASAGHTATLKGPGEIEVVSSRYPYCFFGDANSPDSTAGVIEFLPFNNELNQFRLIVANAAGKKVMVTWGEHSKEFEGDELANGINLAAEFLNNPFSQPFTQVQQAIREQQNFETPLVKNLMHDLPQYLQLVPEEAESFERIADRLVQKDKILRDLSSAAVKPVMHMLKVQVQE